MSSQGPSPWGTVAAVTAVVACCALLPAIAVGAGVASALAGAAIRYWPLTLAGMFLALWAGLRIARSVRQRRALGERREPSESAQSEHE